MRIYHDTEDGITTEVSVTNDWLFVKNFDSKGRGECLTLTRDEAIAAARAILAHYKEPV